jgi:hypothetical protein
MCIPPRHRPAKWRAKRGRPVVARKEEYRLRYKVERSLAWLGSYRRLLIRWEHLFEVYRSFFAFAIMLLCVRRMEATSGRGDVHGDTTASATMPPVPAKDDR